jgi:multimeric flavodoxin WrbA
MKAVVLDAASRGDTRTQEAADALVAALELRGAEVERVVVRDLDIRPCTGCFGCWTRTPGQCVIADDARAVAAQVVASDLYAVVSPVAFGSFGSLAKSVQDRLICLVLPHFTMIDGEVHHRRRYERYPAMVALGTMPAPSAEQSALFARLVERQSVNMHNSTYAAQTVSGSEPTALAAERLLDAVGLRTEVTA